MHALLLCRAVRCQCLGLVTQPTTTDSRYHLQVHKHLLAAEYQLSAFRDAAAAARTLNRTLILPKLWAWCDSDQPTIMQHCSMEGAQQVAPWQAPTDLYVNMDVRHLLAVLLIRGIDRAKPAKRTNNPLLHYSLIRHGRDTVAHSICLSCRGEATEPMALHRFSVTQQR